MRGYLTLLVLAACQTGPTNGTTVGGSVLSKSFSFVGYTDHPSETVTLEVLKNPSYDPSKDTNWAVFGSTVSGTQEQWVGSSTTPLYQWSTTAVPVPDSSVAARWPQGGVVRIRASRTDANGKRVFNTFDDVTFNDCLAEQFQANADWQTIGTKCNGIGDGITTLVSTTNVPVAPGDASTGGGFLGRKGRSTAAQTELYYFLTGAPLTLADFKSTYGFPSGDVTATYYNDVDLGIGREMHCKWFLLSFQVGVACYVSNYSATPGVAGFGDDPTTVLNHAIAHNGKFATVAMVYRPGQQNDVSFVVYGPDGSRQDTAQLDNAQNNTSIPNNCMSCHGISSSIANGVVTNAKFLPFDPFSFKYSTQAGFTQADQADEFRQLNALVEMTNPAPATTELIDGMYAPKSVTDATAVASNDFVPDAWRYANNSLDGTAIYKGVIKVGCRTCHVSSVSSVLDWNSPDDFTQFISTIRNDVCGQHIMPHAERVMKKFWQSGARAYLVSGYGPASYPDSLQACKP